MQPLATPSLRRRMASWLYEGILIFAVYFFSAYIFLSVSQTHIGQSYPYPLAGFLCLIFGNYFVWFWAKGQTLPMQTWNIRLVDVNGKSVSQKRALIRYCLVWLWFLPPLALVSPFGLSRGAIFAAVLVWISVWAWLSRFHPERQFWHDAWAGTRLVNSPPPSRRA